MFTVKQIKAAHSKVKSGADFPSYIEEIRALGITNFETYVADGRTDYYGIDDYKVSSEALYDVLIVSETVNKEQFKVDLKSHQQGRTDYPTFIKMCAVFGIDRWSVCIDKMTCTYYDKSGKQILVEEIPQH